MPRHSLPTSLSALPSLLKRAESTACRNASTDLASRLIPLETEAEARQHTYRTYRDGVVIRAAAIGGGASSVVAQILAVIEIKAIDEGARMAILGVITAKIDDLDFLIAFRDQFPRS